MVERPMCWPRNSGFGWLGYGRGNHSPLPSPSLLRYYPLVFFVRPTTRHPVYLRVTAVKTIETDPTKKSAL